MEEYKVISLAGLSVFTMEIFENILIIGQPYVNGVIGILTVIYLFKRIFSKDSQTLNKI